MMMENPEPNMDVAERFADKAVKRRFGRSGRRCKSPEQMKRELEAAGRPSGAHASFNFATGNTVKKAVEHLLELVGPHP